MCSEPSGIPTGCAKVLLENLQDGMTANLVALMVNSALR